MQAFAIPVAPPQAEPVTFSAILAAIRDADQQSARTNNLLGVISETFSQFLGTVRLEDKAARVSADQIDTLIDVAQEAAQSVVKTFIHHLVDLNIDDLQAASSVGRHVELARRSDWIAAVDAFKRADAVPPGELDPEHPGDEAAAALQALIGTRAPDLRAFHEKLSILQSVGLDLPLHGASDALLVDVEALVRREQRNAQFAQSVEC